MGAKKTGSRDPRAVSPAKNVDRNGAPFKVTDRVRITTTNEFQVRDRIRVPRHISSKAYRNSKLKAREFQGKLGTVLHKWQTKWYVKLDGRCEGYEFYLERNKLGLECENIQNADDRNKCNCGDNWGRQPVLQVDPSQFEVVTRRRLIEGDRTPVGLAVLMEQIEDAQARDRRLRR